jgi:folate-dependent phosphoribosylglycinamide formyltransferase PurN
VVVEVVLTTVVGQVVVQAAVAVLDTEQVRELLDKVIMEELEVVLLTAEVVEVALEQLVMQ